MKKLLSTLIACMISISAMTSSVSPALAAEAKGTWKLTDTNVVLDGNTDDVTYSYKGIINDKVVVLAAVDFSSPSGWYYSYDQYFECTQPMNSYKPGEEVTLTMHSFNENVKSSETYYNTLEYSNILLGPSGYTGRDCDVYLGSSYFCDSNGNTSLNLCNDNSIQGGPGTVDRTLTVSYSMPEYVSDGDVISIYFCVNNVYYEWRYKYSENQASTPSVQPVPSYGSTSNDIIKIYVNGSQVYPDSDPVIINDRTLVPIRVVAEALGYSVEWNGQSRAVDIHNNSLGLWVPIGSNKIDRFKYDSNGNISAKDSVQSDVAAQIINDRTYLPLRAVGESLGAKVDWDGNTRSVYVTK